MRNMIICKVWRFWPSGCRHRQRNGQRCRQKLAKFVKILAIFILKHEKFHFVLINWWNNLKFGSNIVCISFFKKTKVCCTILIRLSSIDIWVRMRVVWNKPLKCPFLLYSIQIALQFIYFEPLSLNNYQTFWYF